MMLIHVYMKYVNLKFPKVLGIGTQQVAKLLGSSKFVLIDCREKAEVDVSRIPDSTHIPLDISDGQLEEFIANKAAHDVKLVSYCALGYRSAILTERISHLNIDQKFDIEALNLEGSIFKWANENLDLLDLNNNPTTFVHPVAYKYAVPYLKWNKWKWSL